ncbi:MAG TPA: 3',5'-cyclic-nucleotide phosphodiesterase [Pyrinomonadaceae bacterium]|nr:3',5'-cyclic-nucleotide phosphodiesterase [Pyrinomonadaceae bacterium]
MHSTLNGDGSASERQHLTTMIVDDQVAFDAGSLALACSDTQRANIRDIVVSHAHLDHIAGLPLFIDDLFSSLTEPVRIHAASDVIEMLETHIFNWSIYPRFSELNNEFGPVVEYREIDTATEFRVKHLSVKAVEVCHKVPSSGFIISDGNSTIALTGDTAPTDAFWQEVNALPKLDAVLVECAFPTYLGELANISHHMTPDSLKRELHKLDRQSVAIYVVNIKPAFRETTISEIKDLRISGLNILEIGNVYEW